MTLQAIPKYTHVEGVSIYRCNGGQAEAEPAAVDVAINVPEIQFETADIPMMGQMSIVDQTRIGNLELSVTLEADNPNAERLFGAGLVQWKLCYVQSIVLPNGLMAVVGVNIYATGYVTSIPEGTKEVGSQATADYKMNCTALRKVDSNGRVYYDIDRTQGKLIKDGVDLRANVNSLL